MNELQKRLWGWMIQIIDDHEQGEVTFSKLVNNLEKILEAGKFTDEELGQGWNKIWTALQEFAPKRSYASEPDPRQVRLVLEKMRVFLTERKKTFHSIQKTEEARRP